VTEERIDPTEEMEEAEKAEALQEADELESAPLTGNAGEDEAELLEEDEILDPEEE
jgi:hypothetical protein